MTVTVIGVVFLIGTVTLAVTADAIAVWRKVTHSEPPRRIVDAAVPEREATDPEEMTI